MQAWFCAHTRPQQELRAAIELTKQDFHVYTPLIDGKPLFPRYLFVQFDRLVDNWGIIRSTRGCIDLLKNGFNPIEVRQPIMDAIMSYRAPQEATEADPVYSLQQRVRIKSGLLAGYEGLFTGSDKQRTQAFLDILGNKVSVPISTIAPAA